MRLFCKESMANKKLKMLGLFLTTLAILLITAIAGYFAAVQLTVSSVKKVGKQIDYIPEKVSKLETIYESKTGILFRGLSGKLYQCDNGKKICEVISTEPPKYSDKTPFTETKGVYAKFSLPPSKPKQIVFRNSRGLVGHQTISQYALLEDGKVWFWIHSGNEMGDSFPFWHLNNWLPLLIGVICGLLFGSIISAGIWYFFYPKN